MHAVEPRRRRSPSPSPSERQRVRVTPIRVLLAALLILLHVCVCSSQDDATCGTAAGTNVESSTAAESSGVVDAAAAPDDRPQSPPQAVIGELMAETGFYQSMTLKSSKPLLQTKSQYQDISIVETEYYGKVLVLDGVVQLTERDADSYNEMMAHVPMMSHPHPQRVLVIGGGDGYVLSEVLKHSSVLSVDHVDLDEGVISVCREFFPWGKSWHDPRVSLYVADGAKFVAEADNNYYDVIIQDSSDPYTWGDHGDKVVLPSNILYSADHFQNILRILRPGGAFNFQAETFNIPSDLEGIGEWRNQALDVGFASARYGSLMISSYPTGQIGFLLCNKKLVAATDDEDDGEDTDKGEVDTASQEGKEEDNDEDFHTPSLLEVEARYADMVRNGRRTTYYQPKLQFSSFDLPLWVEESVYGSSLIDDINDIAAAGREELRN